MIALGDKFFPRVARTEKCHPSFTTASCVGRRDAVRLGEFWWDFDRGGWVSIMNPLRSMKDWETVWRAGQNTNGEPYLIEICPFCGSALPELKPPHIVDCGDDG